MVIDDSTGKWTVKLMSDDVESLDQGYEGYGYGYGSLRDSRAVTSEGSGTGGKGPIGRISWVDLGRS